MRKSNRWSDSEQTWWTGDETESEAPSPNTVEAGVVNSSTENESVSFVACCKDGYVNHFVASFRFFSFLPA
jgi:hypothetical protein